MVLSRVGLQEGCWAGPEKSMDGLKNKGGLVIRPPCDSDIEIGIGLVIQPLTFELVSSLPLVAASHGSVLSMRGWWRWWLTIFNVCIWSKRCLCSIPSPRMPKRERERRKRRSKRGSRAERGGAEEGEGEEGDVQKKKKKKKKKKNFFSPSKEKNHFPRGTTCPFPPPTLQELTLR